jgi:cell wall-associated NlpC family hydrolase
VAAVLAFARAQLGRPYQWGGAGPTAWDCSGLVQAAYARAGIELTHDAAAQYAATADHPVPLGGLQPGDLVFYGASASTIHHVGIAIGPTEMIDAPYTGAFVRIDPVAATDLFAATRPTA